MSPLPATLRSGQLRRHSVWDGSTGHLDDSYDMLACEKGGGWRMFIAEAVASAVLLSAVDAACNAVQLRRPKFRFGFVVAFALFCLQPAEHFSSELRSCGPFEDRFCT